MCLTSPYMFNVLGHMIKAYMQHHKFNFIWTKITKTFEVHLRSMYNKAKIRLSHFFKIERKFSCKQLY